MSASSRARARARARARSRARSRAVHPARTGREVRGALRDVVRSEARGRTSATAAVLSVVAVVVVANVAGATVVFTLAAFVLPRGDTPLDLHVVLTNLALMVGYLGAAVALGVTRGVSGIRAGLTWLRQDRDPDPDEQLAVLRTPVRVVWIMLVSWGVAVPLFTGVNLVLTGLYAFRIGLAVLIGGLVVSAIGYLLTERVLRPVAGRVLAAGGEAPSVLLGVTARQLLSWGFGTAATLLGLFITGLVSLTTGDASATRLAVVMLTLSSIALVVGLLTEIVTARAVADPVRSVSQAMQRVREGDLDVRVRIYDGSDLGQLQAGFNRMAEGLAERERLRDLFGRHVGPEVARAALERGIELGGELREVAVLFVDVVGSTSLATRQSPQEVVAVLNRFFAVVVEVAERHGGWVDKFEGDAALVVFGAPATTDRIADRALAAGRELATLLPQRVSDVDLGIGLSGGEVVAGHVGAAQRFEYTVIGDPVNEAARLVDVAKGQPARVVAAARLVAWAGPQEQARWHEVERVRLRGRAEETVVLAPEPG